MQRYLKYGAVVLLMIAAACDNKKDAFEVFNEGVALSLDASQEQQNGHQEKAIELNKQAILKFRETLKIDSTHKVARAAIAHSLYLNREFKEAIYWFELSNKIHAPMAANYRELGLCKINVGEFKLGLTDIKTAFKLDTTKEIREITVADLTDIGTLAFDYGKQYIANGDKKQGEAYQQFSLSVLSAAYGIDSTRKDILKMTKDYSAQMGK